MTDWQNYLEKAMAYHGHICSGQILGIRMSLLGLKLLDLHPDDDLRDLVLFLESDRCVADAAYVVTGLTLGRRRVKVYPYGKMAMSFLHLKTGKAFRVWIHNRDRPPKGADLAEFWKTYDDEALFAWRAVAIALPEHELPGPPLRVALCTVCGEEILDCKEVESGGQILCLACAGPAYYTPLE